MHARKKLSELRQLFMKSLKKGKLLELVVPKNTQLDLVGFMELDNEVSFPNISVMSASLLLLGLISRLFTPLFAA